MSGFRRNCVSAVAQLSIVLAALFLGPGPVRAQDETGPVVQITPSAATVSSSTLAVTIDWCDTESGPAFYNNSRYITLNGVNVTGSFDFVSSSSPGCLAHATSSATLTLANGTNQFYAEISDKYANPGSSSATYVRNSLPGRSVTPQGTVVTPEPLNVATQQFTVKSNLGSTNTFTFAKVCPSTYACGTPNPSSLTLAAGASSTVMVSYTPQSLADSGVVKLAMTGGGGSDTGSVKVKPQWQRHLAVSLAFNAGDIERAELCATECFAAKVTLGTVPYFSIGAARNVALAYSSDHAAPRTPVYADVSFTPGTTTASRLTIQVLDSATGAPYSFANGDTQLYFAGGAGPIRLAGVLQTELKPTGAYPIAVSVVANYADHADTLKSYTRLLIVNTSSSPIAAGWGVSGLQRIAGDSVHSAMVYTDDGASVTYFRNTNPATWTAPFGEHSSLSWDTSFVRTYDDGLQVRFDKLGRMRRATDRFGNMVRYEYDGSGRLNRVYDPIRSRTGGADTAYTALAYGANGLATINDPGPLNDPAIGRVTNFTVDASRRLTQMTDPDGRHSDMTYDGSLRLQTMRARNGGTGRYAYDPQSWKLVRVVSPPIAVDDGSGGTRMDSAVMTFRPWQAAGAPQGHTDATHLAAALPFDSTLAVITDAGGHSTRYSADAWGQPIRSVALDGQVTTVQRTRMLPVKILHPGGTSDTLTYDALGYLIRSAGNNSPAIEYTYGPYRQVETIKLDGSEVQRNYYRALVGGVGDGRLDSTRYFAADTSTEHFEWDTRGRLTKNIDPKGHTTTDHYDPITGNLDSVNAPGNRAVRHVFDRVGRDSLMTVSGQLTRRVLYDVMNRPIAQYAGPNAAPVTSNYDSLSTTTTDSKGQIFRSDYNVLGWEVRRYDPDASKGSTYFRYDVEGKLTSTTNRRLQRIQYAYDSLHRPLSIGGAAAVPVTYGYSADGRIITAASPLDTVLTYLNASYDVDSTVDRMALNEYRLTYHRNASNDIDSIGVAEPTAPSVQFAQRVYTWDLAKGRLSQMKINGQVISFGYNGEGARTSTTLPSAVRYDDYTAVHTLGETSYTPSTLNSSLWRGYEFDDPGRFVTRNFNQTANGGMSTEAYAYDGEGRLGSVAQKTQSCTLIDFPVDKGSGSTCSVTSSSTMGFAYDSAGNRTDSGGTYRLGNRDSTFNGFAYDYDADGNLWHKTNISTGAQTTYAWSAEGLLLSVQDASKTVSFDYGANGQPIRRKLNGTVDRYYWWDATPELIAELDSTGNHRISEYAYEPGIDRPAALITGAQAIASVKFFTLEPTGDVAAVLSGSTVSQGVTYDAWGMPSINGATENRLLWKSLLWEPDVGLYFMRARWYDPALGHFISEDPLSTNGGVNAYAFGGGDPVNTNDPTGLFTEAECVFYGWCGGTETGGGSGIMGAGGSNRGPSTIFGVDNGAPIASVDMFGQPWGTQTAATQLADTKRQLYKKCGEYTTELCDAVWDAISTILETKDERRVCQSYSIPATTMMSLGALRPAYEQGYDSLGRALAGVTRLRGQPEVVYLFPIAFISPQELFKTIVHEMYHVVHPGDRDEERPEREAGRCAKLNQW